MNFNLCLTIGRCFLFLGILFLFKYSYSSDCISYLADQAKSGESVFRQRLMSKESFAAIVKEGQENFYEPPHWSISDFIANRQNSVNTVVQYILNFGLPDMLYVDGDWQDTNFLNLKRLLVLEESNFGKRYVLAQASWIEDLTRQVSNMIDNQGYITTYSYSWGMNVHYSTSLRITPSGRVLELQEGLE